MRPTQAMIDLKALCSNYKLAQSISEAKALAVIKADAYGHGAIECAKALEKEADGFAVACIDEALELRDAGILNPILLLEGFLEESELPLIETYNLWTTVHSPWQIKAIEKARLTKKLNVFLKMDSGMHRLGIAPKDYIETYQQLLKTGKVESITLMSHFARADELDCQYSLEQFNIVQQVNSSLSMQTSLSNSPTLLGWPQITNDWVRPGLMLYGVSPFDVQHKLADQLTPVMTLQSKIISVNELPAGMPIGYGGCFVTDKPMSVGIVAMGYASGYPRHAPTGTPVAIDGRLSQILGRVSMGMLTVDLTHLPHAGLGSHVELWGKQISINDIAARCQTISYQLLCNIKRIAKIYHY